MKTTTISCFLSLSPAFIWSPHTALNLKKIFSDLYRFFLCRLSNLSVLCWLALPHLNSTPHFTLPSLFDCACCDLCFLCNCSSFFFCCRPPVEVFCDTWQWRSACVKWVCVSLSFQQPAHSLLNYRWFKTHFSDLYAILLLFQSFATAAAAACTKCRRCGLAIPQSQRSRFCPPRSARTAAFTAITVSSHSFLFFKRERERKVCLLKNVCRMPFSINYLYSWGHILLRGCFCLLSDVLGLASFWLLLEQRQQQQQQHQLNWWVS